MIGFLGCSHGILNLANTGFEIEETLPAKQCCVTQKKGISAVYCHS